VAAEGCGLSAVARVAEPCGITHVYTMDDAYARHLTQTQTTSAKRTHTPSTARTSIGAPGSRVSCRPWAFPHGDEARSSDGPLPPSRRRVGRLV
jgi:hypothetical protein